MSEFDAAEETNIILALREIHSDLQAQSLDIALIKQSLYGEKDSHGLMRRIVLLETDALRMQGAMSVWKWMSTAALGAAVSVFALVMNYFKH